MPDHLHHHDAEGQTGQRVHGVVALQEAGEEGLGGIGTLRLHGADMGCGIQHGHNDQNGQEGQKAGRQDLAHIGEDLAGTQGEKEGHRKEQQGKQQQIQPIVVAGGQNLLQTHGESGGSAPGNGKERPDGQIQRTGEEKCIGTAYLAAEVKEPAAAADTQRGYAQQRQSYARYQKSYNGGPYITAGCLPHIYREDQVPGAEEHTEQHTGYVDILLKTQLLLHR